MHIKEYMENGCKIIIIEAAGDEKVIADVQSALDLMMRAKYEWNTDRIAIDKKAVADDFFILSTTLAGEILEKYIQYGMKLAIFGDFSVYTSKPLKDFIFESNKGKDFFFVAGEEEAVQKLSRI